MRKKQLADNEERIKFDSGFRVMNGEQEFVTYHQDYTIRVWYGDVPDYYSDHWHVSAEIALPAKGRLQYSVQGASLTVAEGDVLFIPPRMTHSMRTPPDSARHLILFDPAPLQSLREPVLLRQALSEPILLRADQPETALIREAAAELLRRYDAGGVSANLRCYGCLTEIYALLTEARARLRPAGPLAQADEDLIPESIRQALGRVYDYVDSHYAEAITLDTAAASAGFSKFYFSRVFSRYTRMSFSQYVLKKRIDAASGLLCGTGMKLSDIARQAGFASLSTFNRVFRAQHGCTPTEFRNLYKKSALRREMPPSED